MNEEHTLYGLAYSCPYFQRKTDCPFNEIDHLSFPEKIEWIDNLSQDKKKAILEHHQTCSQKRRQID
jgi:hypothetical protein